jgi:hypothetical protein
MRTATCILLLTLSTAALADDKPKWEYAELSAQTVPARPMTKDKDGTINPATPPTVTIRWVSGSEEFETKNWGELAEKLKAPFMAEVSETSKRVRVLNLLGDRGWELVGQETVTSPSSTSGGFPPRTSPTTTTLLFKRRR